VFEHQEDLIERIVGHLRLPVQLDPAVDARVMQEIARPPAPGAAGPLGAAWRWLRRPRHFTLSPLGGLAIAAGLAALALALPGHRPGAAPDRPSGARGFQFVVVAPRAARVALVGDFNDWDAARTPMRRSPSGPVWTAVVPLAPGRHRYAFLLDGSRWVADPAAPAARDDEFGAASSVVTVGGS
jgi:hypothetical protein